MHTFENLGELRRRLGYRFEGVLRLTKLEPDRLRLVETGAAAPTVYETEELARIYGVDADALGDLPLRLSPSDTVHALASLDEFREVADAVRARIVSAAQTCRDIVGLRATLSERPSLDRFREERPGFNVKREERLPARQGATVAEALRRSWKLKNAPIASMRDLVASRLPSVEVLYADLTTDGPAGLSFIDKMQGPAIVLNLVGKNTNPLVRRFSLAHELGHLLIDWNARAPLAQISGYLTESGLDREQRANGFAVRLLCPEAVLKRLQRRTRSDDPAQLAEELAKYGLHYAALRLYLVNLARAELPLTPPVEAVLDPGPWAEREAPPNTTGFPLEGVPFERRTSLARLAALAYSRSLVTRGRFAELLGITRAEPLERVLDFFGLDPPAEHAA